MLNLYEMEIHKKVTDPPIDNPAKKDYTVVKRELALATREC